MNWSRAAIVLVTGKGVNTCGHVLLFIPGGFGHYFHFDGPSPFDYPRYMCGDGEYRRYLASSGKHELLRKRLAIPNPKGSEAKLRELMDRKWATILIQHNCATFAMEVVRAGGNFWTFPDECPVLGMGSVLLLERIFGRDAQAIR